MNVTIHPARPAHAEALSDIALRSKGHWGYSSEQLALWREEFLTFTPEFIRDNQVWIAVADEQIVGFAAIKEEDGTAILDDLWVLPAYIGRGVGRQLFGHVAAHVPEFIFTSDPHADNFYYKMGAEKIGEQPSTIQGRTLTLFRYRRTANQSGGGPVGR
ncbi:MAG: GNAT family N-acetyltransferase [Caldilineaceae bacterium]|nr:GNAT family N-acetyltransferase [Caldilineaceae bacterium]